MIYSFKFVLIWASGKLMYICRTPNSRRARISYYVWAYRKLSETGSGVLAYVKSDFAQIVCYNCKDV